MPKYFNYNLGGEKMKEMLEGMYDKVDNQIRRLRTGVKNLIKWFPIIWKDRDWDYHYLMIMLRYKLICMEKLIRENARHVGYERSTNNMKKCIMTLNRIIDDRYYDLAFGPHDRKWGEIDMDWHECEDSPDLCQLELSRPNAVTEEEKDLETKQFRVCSKNMSNLERQDVVYLFSMMTKYVKEWWD